MREGVTIKKARKTHKCLFCGQFINKGEKYAHMQITPWSHPDNEGFEVWRSHERCEKEVWSYYAEDISLDGGLMFDLVSEGQKEFREHMFKKYKYAAIDVKPIDVFGLDVVEYE